MLESDAKTKLCPFKLGLHSDPARLCDGLACMGWDEWTDPVYKKDTVRTVESYKPKDPPEGHCGMKPPELDCRGGYG